MEIHTVIPGININVGKAAKFKLAAPVSTYQAVSGIIQIYGR